MLLHGIGERLSRPLGQECFRSLVLLPVEFVQVNIVPLHRSASHYHPCQKVPNGVMGTPRSQRMRYSERGKFDSRFRLVSTCMVQTRKIIAPSIEIPSGHTTKGCRTNEVVSPASEQNRSAPIAFRKPASLRNARCPMAQAARRAAIATNPRIRGAIMLVWTDQGRRRHALPDTVPTQIPAAQPVQPGNRKSPAAVWPRP